MTSVDLRLDLDPVGVELVLSMDGQSLTLSSEPSSLVLGTPVPVGTVGEINTGANVGGGAGLFRDKTLVSLNFRSLLGVDLAVTQQADTVTVAHGDQAGGTLHAAATPLVAGFMGALDKSKLDGIAAGATNTPLASSAPTDVTRASAVVGVSAAAARADHKHDISVAAPVTIASANAEGVSASLARADHVHAHGSQGGGTDHAVATGAVAGFMSAADKTKLDTVATGATATPLTASAPADVTKSAAVAGVSAEAARADHKHDISTAAAVAIAPGGANAEGSASTLARSDHTHALPAFGSSASTFTEGNDPRLSDARTPTAHAATHQHGGSDEVATATAAANAIPKAGAGAKLDNAWINNASTTQLGIVELADSTEVVAGLALQASDTRLPLQGENDALQGTSGTPSGTNRYVTDADVRLDPLQEILRVRFFA